VRPVDGRSACLPDLVAGARRRSAGHGGGIGEVQRLRVCSRTDTATEPAKVDSSVNGTKAIAVTPVGHCLPTTIVSSHGASFRLQLQPSPTCLKPQPERARPGSWLARGAGSSRCCPMYGGYMIPVESRNGLKGPRQSKPSDGFPTRAGWAS